MYKILKSHREKLKELRLQRKGLREAMRANKQSRKLIEEEMSRLRADIKKIKGTDREW